MGCCCTGWRCGMNDAAVARPTHLWMLRKDWWWHLSALPRICGPLCTSSRVRDGMGSSPGSPGEAAAIHAGSHAPSYNLPMRAVGRHSA